MIQSRPSDVSIQNNPPSFTFGPIDPRKGSPFYVPYPPISGTRFSMTNKSVKGPLFEPSWVIDNLLDFQEHVIYSCQGYFYDLSKSRKVPAGEIFYCRTFDCDTKYSLTKILKRIQRQRKNNVPLGDKHYNKTFESLEKQKMFLAIHPANEDMKEIDVESLVLHFIANQINPSYCSYKLPEKKVTIADCKLQHNIVTIIKEFNVDLPGILTLMNDSKLLPPNRMVSFKTTTFMTEDEYNSNDNIVQSDSEAEYPIRIKSERLIKQENDDTTSTHGSESDFYEVQPFEEKKEEK